MTILKITVEDEQVDLVRDLLKGSSFVKNIEEDHLADSENKSKETSVERLKALFDSAKGKNLFADIKDPSEWQREIRKEWDRDF